MTSSFILSFILLTGLPQEHPAEHGQPSQAQPRPPAQQTPAQEHPAEHAQPNQAQPRPPAQQDHAAMPHEMAAAAPSDAGQMLMKQASGTSSNPSSSPEPMLHWSAGEWTLMLHGLVYLSNVQQNGPRGGDKLFSTNWLMGMASRKFGSGNLMFRSMLSADPATVTKRRYPLLFQTGEEAFGRPIVDGQHPHDLFMELSVQYAHQFGESTNVSVYAAPVGDPALGPVAFPHRISAMEIPQAALAHHLQDSTHIANDVVTFGIGHRRLRWEASGFHGTEPDENRWNIDYGTINSWSTRLVLSPNSNWTGQASIGRLKQPEAHDTNDTVRSTASITYNRPSDRGNWATSVIWGRNHHTPEVKNLNSYLIESALKFRDINYVTGRAELLDRDELLADPDLTFRIAAFTVGYTRDVNLIFGVRTAFGGNVTLYRTPSALTPTYGENPAGFLVFFKLAPKGMMQHTGH
jgi:hypothetical protein